MTHFIIALCALVAVATARMAYVLPDGAESILKARTYSQNFKCEGRPYGYYADVDNNCEIFHICLPVTDGEGALVETAHFSFICGNQTIFSQDTLVCDHPEEAFPCDQAKTLYELSNADFGVIPEEKRN